MQTEYLYIRGYFLNVSRLPLLAVGVAESPPFSWSLTLVYRNFVGLLR